MVDRIAGLILAAGDADRARKMGAEGVGLCRTEHSSSAAAGLSSNG